MSKRIKDVEIGKFHKRKRRAIFAAIAFILISFSMAMVSIVLIYNMVSS